MADDPFRALVADSISALTALQESDDVCAGVVRLAGAISKSFAAGGTLWLFGNGGSAADAQHVAAEFVGRFVGERRALPAVALTTNSSALTAIANDYGFEDVFSRQLEAQARPGDVAIGISTSGRSENVRRGLESAGRIGLHTAALTAGDAGALRPFSAECIAVPATSTARVQECHIVIGHALAQLVEAELREGGLV
jgi:D-sedoheptulose 7-phosphate isomerase